MGILFTYPEQFKSLLSLLSRVHQFRFIHSQLSALVLQILPVHHSSILLSALDFFVLLYLNSIKHLRSFFNSSRRFVLFSSIIFNSYGGPFKIHLLLLSYQFIRCFQIPPVVPSIPSQVYAISLLILSTRISSMPNLLLVINLNW